MWLTADTSILEREQLIRKHKQDMWKVYFDPAIILGNLRTILESPVFEKLNLDSIDPKFKEDVIKAVPLVSQLLEKAQIQEATSTGG